MRCDEMLRLEGGKEVGNPRATSNMHDDGYICGAGHLMFQMDNERGVGARETESVSSECPPFTAWWEGGGGRGRDWED